LFAQQNDRADGGNKHQHTERDDDDAAACFHDWKVRLNGAKPEAAQVKWRGRPGWEDFPAQAIGPVW
jgi:hypothetical protein